MDYGSAEREKTQKSPKVREEGKKKAHKDIIDEPVFE